MKKVLFSLLLSFVLLSCGTAYNSALKQIELGMSESEVVSLMGTKYTVVDNDGGSGNQTIMYHDRYKNDWYFTFSNGNLVKWYKETSN